MGERYRIVSYESDGNTYVVADDKARMFTVDHEKAYGFPTYREAERMVELILARGIKRVRELRIIGSPA